MKKIKESPGLWAPYKKSGKLRYVRIPLPIFGFLIESGNVRTKIISLIARLTFGFNRQWTHGRYEIGELASDLGYVDSACTSREIKKLLTEGILQKKDKKGNGYRWGLNASFFGIQLLPDEQPFRPDKQIQYAGLAKNGNYGFADSAKNHPGMKALIQGVIKTQEQKFKI